MFGWLSRVICPRRKYSTISRVFTNDSCSRLQDMLQDVSKEGGLKIESLASRFDTLQFRPLIKSLHFSKIGYLPLLEVENFTLCMFYIPFGKALPFHNHPDQHVLQRVVFGELEITSFDIHGRSKIEPGQVYTPDDNSWNDTVVTCKDSTMIVKPDQANIHRIRAKGKDHGALFMDLVFPPYNSEHSIVYFEDIGDGTVKSLRERDVCIDMELVGPEKFFQHP